jgi:uncharacterized protein
VWNGLGFGESTLEPTELAGWIAAFFMGAALGIFGAGGSILTVPILVFAFGQRPTAATHDALLVVAIVSTFALLKSGGVQSLKPLLPFSFTSLGAALFAKIWILPWIPPLVPVVGLPKENFLLVLFAVLMALGAGAMLRAPGKEEGRPPSSVLHLVFAGVLVGLVTGLLGAGGGFLIVPALVAVLGIPISHAMRASLFVIAVNTSMAFLAGGGAHSSWRFLLPFVSVATLGMWGGLYVQGKIPALQLKRFFALFVFSMAVYVLLRGWKTTF